MAQNRFLILTSDIMQNKKLNANDKLILAYVKCFTDNDKTFYCSNSQIVNFLGISKSSVLRSLKKLEDLDLIRIGYYKDPTSKNLGVDRRLIVDNRPTKKINKNLAKQFERALSKSVKN